MPATVLGYRLPTNSFETHFPRQLRETAATEREAAGSSTASPMLEQRARLLERIAATFEDLHADDPVKLMIYHANQGKDFWEPAGDKQSQWQANVGRSVDLPTAADALADLAYAGLLDTQAAVSKERQRGQGSRAKADLLDAERTRTSELETELGNVKAELKQAHDEKQALADQLKTLRNLLPAADSASPRVDEDGDTPSAPTPSLKVPTPTTEDRPDGEVSDKPRRQKVEGLTGIYETDSGEIQIGFKAADGKQRWETLNGEDGSPLVETPEQAAEIRASRVKDAKALREAGVV